MMMFALTVLAGMFVTVVLGLICFFVVVLLSKREKLPDPNWLIFFLVMMAVIGSCAGVAAYLIQPWWLVCC